MARYKGTFAVSANYEPLIAAPFDARQLVETKADLIDPAIWQRADGSVWTFTGMIVSVAADSDPANNGVYVLINEDFTKASNWRKCADERDVEHLLEKINNIEFTGEGTISIEVDERIDLPKVGAENTVYYVKEDLSINRWDEETQTYLSYGGSGGNAPELDIKVIYGGNAHGTD